MQDEGIKSALTQPLDESNQAGAEDDRPEDRRIPTQVVAKPNEDRQGAIPELNEVGWIH